MTPLRKILEELLMPAEIMLRQKGLKVKFSTDLAHQQILALIEQEKMEWYNKGLEAGKNITKRGLNE